jgi:transposase
MPFYCGMDLSARDCQVCVIDEALSLLVQEKVQTDLSRLMKLIEPFKATLQIVVESTFNWYWLVDGLQDAGYKVCLAHTLGLYMLTGAEVKTDRRDACALAKRLKAGMIPKASIHPKDGRPIRDLRRHRSTLVTLRAAEYGGLRRLLLRHGILAHSRNDSKSPRPPATRGSAAARLTPWGRLYGRIPDRCRRRVPENLTLRGDRGEMEHLGELTGCCEIPPPQSLPHGIQLLSIFEGYIWRPPFPCID